MIRPGGGALDGVGHYLYIDDVDTVEGARGRGHADTLMTWVLTEAHHRNCEGVHLDSGVTIDRAAAHRLYMRHHMHISARVARDRELLLVP